MTDVALDREIAKRQGSWLVFGAEQPGALGPRRDRGRVPVPLLRHRRFRHGEELLQHHAKLHLRRDHRARHDRRDHHRGHRPVGRLGAVPVQHGAGGDDACRLGHRGGDRRRDRHGARGRRLQRGADRLFRLPVLRGDARDAVGRAQPGDGRVEQHRRLPVRARPREAARARRRVDLGRSPTRCST